MSWRFCLQTLRGCDREEINCSRQLPFCIVHDRSLVANAVWKTGWMMSDFLARWWKACTCTNKEKALHVTENNEYTPTHKERNHKHCKKNLLSISCSLTFLCFFKMSGMLTKATPTSSQSASWSSGSLTTVNRILIVRQNTAPILYTLDLTQNRIATLYTLDLTHNTIQTLYILDLTQNRTAILYWLHLTKNTMLIFSILDLTWNRIATLYRLGLTEYTRLTFYTFNLTWNRIAILYTLHLTQTRIVMMYTLHLRKNRIANHPFYIWYKTESWLLTALIL